MSLLGLGAVSVAVACASTTPDDEGSSTADIVGGKQDLTSYPSVGYLVFRIDVGPHAGEIWRPDCDATLVSPTVVLTAAHCVERMTNQDQTVVGVGFGDGQAGRTIAVKGTWTDWVIPDFMPPSPFPPDAGLPPFLDHTYDVALVTLAEPVTDLVPLEVVTSDRQLPIGTTANEIGYGRVTEGTTTIDIPDRPDAMAEFPGTRKRTTLTISKGIAKFLGAKPAAGTTGGVCYGDSGGTLILSDNTIAGVLSQIGNADCDPTGVNYWADLRLPATQAFLKSRL